MSNATAFARLFPKHHRAIRRIARSRKAHIPDVLGALIEEAAEKIKREKAMRKHAAASLETTASQRERYVGPLAGGASHDQALAGAGSTSQVDTTDGKVGGRMPTSNIHALPTNGNAN